MIKEDKGNGWNVVCGLSTTTNGLGEGAHLDLTGFSSLLVTDLDYFVANIDEITETVTNLIAQRNKGRKKLVYIALPYYGNTEKYIADTEKASIELIKRGFNVVTPHKSTTGYGLYGDIEGKKWKNQINLNLLSKCDAIYTLNNSNDSEDTAAVIAFAKGNNLPIIRIDE